MNNLKKIIFWQKFLSPHISYLVDQLAAKGIEAILITEKLITSDRKQLGWPKPKLVYAKSINIKNYNNKLTSKFFLKESFNICQGIFFNGFIRLVQKKLRKNNLNQWLLMEKINDSGYVGIIKNFFYSCLFFVWKKKINGILAIGNGAGKLYEKRGFDKNKIFPFAYFLNESILNTASNSYKNPIFKFVFVGNLIKRKNVILLLEALVLLKKNKKFQLQIIGNGPLIKDLINYAKKILPDSVQWTNALPMKAIPKKIADADCLVLPSFFDGWGAVVSESLMVGTPVICSDGCGSSIIVKSSKFGYVFKNNDVEDLYLKLKKIMNKGKISRKKRTVLKRWARCLGVKSGADYLIKILLHASKIEKKPIPPWETKR